MERKDTYISIYSHCDYSIGEFVCCAMLYTLRPRRLLCTLCFLGLSFGFYWVCDSHEGSMGCDC